MLAVTRASWLPIPSRRPTLPTKMNRPFFTFLVVFAVLTSFATADIIGDLLGFDLVGALSGDTEEKKAPSTSASGAVKREDDDTEASKCDCDGAAGCNCCVDFNLTSIIDLGGPGCVKMRFISQEEGINLNVSYGDSLLHSQAVKQNDKKGSCMNLLSEFAQICAKFDSLRQTDDGFEGCLNFEPHVLGEVTAKYHIGCFKMGPEGMVQDEKLADSLQQIEQPEDAEEDDDDSTGTSSILDVVNEGAEQGIAFFSDLLGIKRPGAKKTTTTEKQVEEATEATQEAEEEAQEEEQETRRFTNKLLLRNSVK